MAGMQKGHHSRGFDEKDLDRKEALRFLTRPDTHKYQSKPRVIIPPLIEGMRRMDRVIAWLEVEVEQFDGGRSKVVGTLKNRLVELALESDDETCLDLINRQTSGEGPPCKPVIAALNTARTEIREPSSAESNPKQPASSD